jgi:hypothetical protein
MKDLKKVIREHWPVLVVATIFGLAILLPTVLSISQAGKDFKGIYPLLSDDESHYMTMVKEAYDGHPGMSNPYIKEYKTGPYTQPALADIFLSDVAKVLHISLQVEAAINDFLLPCISVLLLYTFLFRLTQSKKISLLFSSVFFIFFLALFNRPINPQFSFVFLMIGLHLVWSIVLHRHSVKKIVLYNVLFSIIFGILVYMYPFYWMTLIMLYGGLTLYRLWIDRDVRYWMKNWLVFFIPALIWSTPFLLNAKALAMNAYFVETTLRNGYISTHIPGAFLAVIPLILCLPILWLLGKIHADKEERDWESKKLHVLGWTCVFGGIILNWQNIITGKTIQFTSHLYPISVLFVCIIAALVCLSMSDRAVRNSATGRSLIFLLIIVFSGIIYLQKNSIAIALHDIYSPQNIAPLQTLAEPMQWLNDHTPPDSAVYTLGNNFDWAIPVYTKDNIYFKSNVGIFLVSDNELEQRWTIEHFFDTVDYNTVYGNRDIWLDKFIDTYQSKEIQRKLLQMITGRHYPETTLMDQASIDRVVRDYGDFKKEGFEKALKTYAADYIIVDGADPRYSTVPEKFKAYSFLQPMVQIDNTFIYKVN